MSQLICKNLLVGYEGKAILDPLNFEIHAGDYLCVVGENGAGKSTLMKTLLGLQQPISGQIEMGDGLRQNEIGYLPQQTIVQRDFPASVQEIVLSGCQSRCGLRPFYSREEKQLAQNAMRKMQIEPLNRQEGITVLMISHDIRAAACYASHILHIGESVFFGTREEYLQSPQGRLFAAGKGGAV